MSNNQWGKPPPSDEWSGNQWGSQQPQQDQWGGNQWGNQQPQQDQWGGNQWGNQQPQQDQWNQQPQMGQMPPYMRAEKSSCCLKWVLGSGLLMTLLCVACSVGIFFIGKNFVNVTPSIEAFMQAGKANDVEAAMQLLSSEPDLSREEIQEMFEDRELFDDVKDISFPNKMSTNEFKTENMKISASGTINYTSGEDGRYFAELIKQNGQWRIKDMSIRR